MYPVPQASAQEADTIYYDLAAVAFGEDGTPIFDVCGDEVRESFVRVTPKIWHIIPSLVWSG
jgi:hypothetical protein